MILKTLPPELESPLYIDLFVITLTKQAKRKTGYSDLVMFWCIIGVATIKLI